MSDSKLPEIVVEDTTDLTEQDRTRIEAYKEAGLPGLTALEETKLARIMDLYLSGKTYRQIATTMQLKKDMILYLSDRFNWFLMRKEYLEDLEKSIRARLVEAKVVNQDFLLQLIHMWQKKIGNNIDQYFITGNVDHANNIDLKEIASYMKAVEMVHKLGQKDGGSTPAVGLNLGDGVTVERKGDGTVEITPKSAKIGEALKAFADMRRVEEKVPPK